MGDIALAGATSGSITLTPTAVAGSNTLTLPAATGTVMVSGNMPAFSAYISGGNQAISANTWTKVTFNTEEFDTASCFNTSTYRFTPNVAGYYQVNLMVYDAAGGTTQLNASIYKNGANAKASYLIVSTYQLVAVPAIIYLNGSTDYIEAYAYTASAGGNIAGDQNYCYFQAYLARAA